MNHIILLGDSIFDNGAYIETVEPAVIEQLCDRLLDGDRATLLALDGSVAQEIRFQLSRLPQDATHLVISTGGNDALRASVQLQQEHKSGYELLEQLHSIKQQFQFNYQEMLTIVSSYQLPIVLCTIYDQCPLQDPVMAGLMFTALSMFNDVIFRGAVEQGLPVIDLRVLCNEPKDYSLISPIEPSCVGGDKIAKAIDYVVSQHPFKEGRTIVY